MINKGIALGVVSLAFIGAAAYGVNVYASQSRTAGQFGPNYTPERHTQMQAAFENNDYAAWKNQMGNRGATRVVNEQNFARFTQMHNLMLEGKTAEAAAIRTELGLGQGGGQGQCKGQGGCGMHKEQGQNKKGNFVDANGDGKCDRMK